MRTTDQRGQRRPKLARPSCRSFAANTDRLQPHGSPNLGELLRPLATPEPIKDWSRKSLKEKRIKIGAKVFRQKRHLAFQMAEVAIHEVCSPKLPLPVISAVNAPRYSPYCSLSSLRVKSQHVNSLHGSYCMKSNQVSAVARYASSGNKQVGGWFSRVDAEIFRAILDYQLAKGLSGSAIEIGVHHGRAFIEMCLSLTNNEMGYCVDVFEAQHLNLDRSGHGNREQFESNLRKFGISPEQVYIDSRSSIDVKASEILSTVGAARFFSIDGGHWLEIVKNDLTLAEACLAPHGVIALDDFLRSEWPDVSTGWFAWYPTRKKPIMPFAIGFNKLYLCEAPWADVYRNLIASDSFLKEFFIKTADLNGLKVAVYQEFILPEWTVRTRTKAFLKLYYPNLFVRLKRCAMTLNGWRQKTA